MKAFKNKKRKGFFVIIAIGIVALLILVTFVAAAVFVGSRKGAGSDGKLVTDANNPNYSGDKVDCSGLKFNSTYYPWVKDAAAKYIGGDEAALIAMIQIESGWDPTAANPTSSAAGLGQFLTSSAKGWPEFTGGDDKHGTTWPAGTLYDQPRGHSDDARFEAKRSIYAAAHYVGGLMTRYGSVGAAYQEGYHGYCKNMSNPDCQSQLAAAKSARVKLEKYYNDLKSGSCTQSTPPTVASGSCSNIISNATAYFGLPYHHAGCGPNTVGPAGVTALDCSAYSSRVYHDSGVTPTTGWCATTAVIPGASFLTLVSSDVNTAKKSVQPGDLILMPGHVVMYGGESGNVQSIYESSGEHAGPNHNQNIGPHLAHYNIWSQVGRAGGLVGVYRAKSCK